jgi:hypothetical protein
MIVPGGADAYPAYMVEECVTLLSGGAALTRPTDQRRPGKLAPPGEKHKSLPQREAFFISRAYP